MNRPVYTMLLEKKNVEGKLDISILDRDTLMSVWGDEHLTDSDIAKLFDVSTYRINKLRTDFGISMKSYVVETGRKALLSLPFVKARDIEAYDKAAEIYMRG